MPGGWAPGKPWPAPCSLDAGAKVLRPRKAGEGGAEEAGGRSPGPPGPRAQPAARPIPEALASPPRSPPLH